MNITSLPNTCHDEIPQAVIKASALDFQVVEILGFDPAAEGEHLWVNVCKSGINTRDVVGIIARTLGIAARDIGYSGLKDRNAITTQWMSIPLAKVCDRLTAPLVVQQVLSQQPGVDCLRVCHARKKLKRGTHRCNRFTIVLRDIKNPGQLRVRALEQLAERGFPNYFGAQRFGRNGSNLAQAISMFRQNSRASRFKRGLYLSAARAQLFNLVLARRVQDGSWDQIIDGELCMLDGTQSVFTYSECDHSIHKRCRELDVHPTGPLHGRGDLLTGGLVSELENAVIIAHPDLSRGLEAAGLKRERRALRAVPSDLKWRWLDDETLELSFILRSGVYATSLLAEIADIQDASTNNKPVTNEKIDQ